ncbi:MAG: AmmeMemoRadiSam system protein B [Candidatus Micrarchaeota archaeon]|nr:AmmeMemoRadiSam system protein B [Candidatus Micrarchaeota archaeon]
MRQPAVAGLFYPASSAVLEREVKYLLQSAKSNKIVPSDIIISPHAGYIYSGKTAALSFLAAENFLKKENCTVIIIGPNHTGLGKRIALSMDEWLTSLGKISTNQKFCTALLKNCMIIEQDELAHLHEHSIEVMLPFIQVINPKAKIVAICLGIYEKNLTKIVGQAISQTMKQKEFEKENFVVVASSDFSHYLDGESAKKLDSLAIEQILKLNNDEFENLVLAKDISICGHEPISTIIEVAKLQGKKKGELLKYTNSGIETNSSTAKVVAYASIVFV